MFKTQSPLIEQFSKDKPQIITLLDNIFVKKATIYVDYANVLGLTKDEIEPWNFDIRKLDKFLKCFDGIEKKRLYYGKDVGNHGSELIQEIVDKQTSFELRTKKVKYINIKIDMSGIPKESTQILKSFIDTVFLKKLKVEDIEYLNNILRKTNREGEYVIKKRKCNFDVEITRDMDRDLEAGFDSFILWSNDSDFVDPVESLLDIGKSVTVFAPRGKVTSEFNKLKEEKGLTIFDASSLKDILKRNL